VNNRDVIDNNTNNQTKTNFDENSDDNNGNLNDNLDSNDNIVNQEQQELSLLNTHTTGHIGNEYDDSNVQTSIDNHIAYDNSNDETKLLFNNNQNNGDVITHPIIEHEYIDTYQQ